MAAALLAVLDEDDPGQVCRANAAVDRDAAARSALRAILPTTVEGLRALSAFHAKDMAAMEPGSMGVVVSRHLSEAVAAVIDGPSAS